MSQQDIFKKAIAAKLAGDEEGFKAAISEAIKSKAKAMLAEGKLTESRSTTEEYGVTVMIPAEVCAQLGLPAEEGTFDVEGDATVWYYPGERETRDDPGSEPGCDFELATAFVWTEDGNKIQVDPKVMSGILTDEDHQKIYDQLMDSAHERGADHEAESRYIRRHGSLPDDY